MSYRKSRHHRPDQIPAWTAWIVLGIFLLAYHLKVSVNLGDDASFVHALDNQNLISWAEPVENFKHGNVCADRRSDLLVVYRRDTGRQLYHRGGNPDAVWMGSQ